MTPWLLPEPGVGWVAVGALALVVLLVSLAYWIAPVALWPARTAQIVGEDLVAPTARGERSIRLPEVHRIWSRSLFPDDVETELIGLATPTTRLWLAFSERIMPGGLRPRLRELAADPQVRTSARARRWLEVEGAPTGWAVIGLAVRSAALAGTALLGSAGLILIYVIGLLQKSGS